MRFRSSPRPGVASNLISPTLVPVQEEAWTRRQDVWVLHLPFTEHLMQASLCENISCMFSQSFLTTLWYKYYPLLFKWCRNGGSEKLSDVSKGGGMTRPSCLWVRCVPVMQCCFLNQSWRWLKALQLLMVIIINELLLCVVIVLNPLHTLVNLTLNTILYIGD